MIVPFGTITVTEKSKKLIEEILESKRFSSRECKGFKEKYWINCTKREIEVILLRKIKFLVIVFL